MNNSDKLRNLQEDAEEVRVIMQENLEKVDERGEKLEDLEGRAAEIEKKSKLFAKTCKKLNQKHQVDNRKWKIAAFVVFLIILLCIIIPIVCVLRRRGENESTGED